MATIPALVFGFGQVVGNRDVLLAFLALAFLGDGLGGTHHLLVGIEQFLIRAKTNDY